MLSSEILPVAEYTTSSKFTRPGDYCTLRVDNNNIPHIVWTDGRVGHLDIYYAHGITVDYVESSTSVPGFKFSILLVVTFVLVIKLQKEKIF